MKNEKERLLQSIRQNEVCICQKNLQRETLQMNNFYKDLKKLQSKYPMCYIEAWTPEDYISVDTDYDNDEEEADWNDEDHIKTSNALYNSFNANIGTNWDRIIESK